jgi:hypothetical protein
MTDPSKFWFDHQSADVQAELANLIDYRPEPEFMQLLSQLLPIVPCRGLIDLYYDIWYCVPSRLALRIALRQLHHPEELAAYLALAERVLIDVNACEAFSAQLTEVSDVDEVLFWLKRRAR